MKYILNCLVIIGFSFGLQATTQQIPGFTEILNIVKDRAELANADADTVLLAQMLMTQILTDKDAFNLLTEENGHFSLSEENAQYVFGLNHLKSVKDSVKDAAIDKINSSLERYYNAKDYGREKYDRWQEKLDEKMPVFRNKLADALLYVNEGLSKIDPKWIAAIITVLGEITGAVASVVGASFGVPILPGLAVGLATLALGNTYTVSGALAGAKTFLDIVEEILRVDPNAPEQDPAEKGKALQKITAAAKFVLEHYVANFAVYKPSEVALIKDMLKGVGQLYAYFF
jgi:hypothetical protein